ncbi:ERMARD [Bugula neritina]|uniref:ERMARD n=1 Tax=Bugula neritina TaxID=10212 RepID=A0A7J7KRF8_BUGNE|nr:ERMARD [Bugula neritina]
MSEKGKNCCIGQHSFQTQIQLELEHSDFSSLSMPVKKLLAVINQNSIAKTNISLNILTDLLLVETHTYQSKYKDRDSNYYSLMASHLGPLFIQIKTALLKVNSQTYVEHNSEYLMWLCVSAENLVELLSNAQSNKTQVQYCACLCLTSILERSLQNVHWTLVGYTPTVLKDLLVSDVLFDLLGEDIMALLDILVGPPVSFNIRNLVWHGFGSVDVGPEQYSLIIFFILVIIGKTISGSKVVPSHRPYLKVNLLYLLDNVAIQKHDMVDEFLAAIANFNCKSKEVKLAMQYAKVGKYGFATSLLITSFEQWMRVAYCFYNRCPSRLMTAVNNEFFTTLDHVFEEYLHDGTTNNVLHDILPDRLRAAIFDLFYHSKGLRLRDKLSHMEISYNEITKETWCYVFNIISSAIMCTIFDGSSSDIYSDLVHFYSPAYHPISFLVRCFENFGDLLTVLKTIQAPMYLEFKILDSKTFEASCSSILKFFKCEISSEKSFSVDQLFSLGVPQPNARKILTSSVFMSVAEWCKWLQSATFNIVKSINLVSDFCELRLTMLKNRDLRSRQRKNFIAFLSSKNLLELLFQTLFSLNNGFLMQIADKRCVCQVEKSHRILLQLTENIYSLAEQNKWVHLIDFCIAFIETNFSQL